MRDLDLEVGDGEIVGLIGPNGAGKSTTLHAIMGARAGARRATSASPGARSAAARRRRSRASGIALVPEGRRIFAELTVEENLRLGLARRRTRDGSDEALEEVYELFPIVREFRRRQAGALSGRPAAAARDRRGRSSRRPTSCCSTSPRSGSRRRSSTSCSRRSPRSAAAGSRVLLVEQRAQRTVAFADRTYLIANGEVRLTLTPADAGDTETHGRTPTSRDRRVGRSRRSTRRRSSTRSAWAPSTR